MIPRKIHYCWFGGNPLPDLAKKCIKSWKKYCKGYEIIEWNEKNFDIASAPLYVRQAYEAKKWAFVTDYVRLYAMTKFGGIYMDTDVEVVSKLDIFLKHQAFSGFESDVNIPTGIMACEKDFPMFVKFLKYYDTAVFVNEDGSLNTKTNVEIITEECLKNGLIQNNTYQVINGFALYPNEYFCPINMTSGHYDRSGNTATIHWFNGSWLPDTMKDDKEFYYRHNKQRNKKYIEKRRNQKISKLPKRILGVKLYATIHDFLLIKKK